MRYLDSKCKLCRREEQKLFLKGDRCYSPKCLLERKGAVPPGLHGSKRKRRLSEFGKQLREKQKMKRIYSVSETQFKNYVNMKKPLLQLLESRLDNVVYRLGFVSSRSIARQIISHGHLQIDAKRVNVPSYQLKPGQIITLTPKALEDEHVKKMLSNKDYQVPTWLKRKAAVGRMEKLPERSEIDTEVDEKLIMEYYSR